MQAQKQQQIVDMFDNIAPTYDIANRILSAGVDRSWRKKAVAESLTMIGQKDIDLVVDVACGTGDMISYWMEGAKEQSVNLLDIAGVDPSVKMLGVAKEKLKNVQFHEGYADKLPFEDSQADIISIVYGIRNVVNLSGALAEFYRVLKPGGVLVVLEFTKKPAKTSLLEKGASFYQNKVLPFVGGIISGNYKAYKYLPDSIDEFLTSDMLQQEMQKAGFKPLFIKGYSANISTTFIVKKESE